MLNFFYWFRDLEPGQKSNCDLSPDLLAVGLVKKLQGCKFLKIKNPQRRNVEGI